MLTKEKVRRMTAKNCAVLECADLLGKKWTYPILDGVAFQPGIRYNQLLRTLETISPKVLAMRLEELEQAGILKNIVQKKNNAKTSKYFLTPQGKDLQQALKTLKKWGARWNLVSPTCPHENCATCKLEFATQPMIQK